MRTDDERSGGERPGGLRSGRVRSGRTWPVIAVAVVALLALLAWPAAPPAPDALAAPSVDSLKEDKAAAEAQAEELMSDVAALNDRLKAANGRYAELQQQLERARQRVGENRTEVQDTTRLLDLSRQVLEQRVVAIYKQPSPSLLDIVFQADSFESLVSSITMMKRIGTSDAELVDEVEATREDLLLQRSRLVSARGAAADLVAAAEAERASIESTLAARRQALDEAQTEVKRIVRRIEEERAEARRREAQRRAAATAAMAGASSGTAPRVADGARYTQETWGRELLRRADLPLTPANISAVVSWQLAEGGHWFNTAYYNPLNTTMPAPGATPMNSVGVKAYTSWEQGFAATLATLRNGFYDGVLAALRRGTSAQAVSAAVGASPWGTGHFTVR